MRAATRRRARTTCDDARRASRTRRRASLALLPALPPALLLGLSALPASAADAQTTGAPTEQPAERPCHLVADGRRVRARERDREGRRTTHVGTALAWGTPAPRLVTAGGDTLPLNATQQVWVSGGRTARRTARGALIGWAAGVAAVVADCGLAASCGEQNPVPLLGILIGGAIGHKFRTERWTRVPAVTSSTCGATPP